MPLVVMLSTSSSEFGNARGPAKKGYARELSRKYGMLASNRRFEKGHNDRESILLTARKDLVGIRSRILDGDMGKALEKTDWLIDNIDNMLSEGC